MRDGTSKDAPKIGDRASSSDCLEPTEAVERHGMMERNARSKPWSLRVDPKRVEKPHVAANPFAQPNEWRY